jgi:cysteine desulfurase / selenocysteine lyase
MDAPATGALDLAHLRADFPALAQEVHGKPLVYLDNAATTQKPHAVIHILNRYYSLDNANIHRGVHYLSERATFAYEKARGQAKRFLHAASEKEIVFTRGATEALNLVAYSWGGANIKAGDEIIISAMEHHSNIVPWQMLCEKTGAKLRVVPINDAGELLMDEYEKLLSERTKLVSIVWISNSLGTVNPIREIVAKAKKVGATTIVDAAQAVSHTPVDVSELGCDFFVLSGHKLFGPTGVGLLYGRQALLEAMPPWQGGGDMIKSVTFEKTLYQEPPFKFEAGTPHIAGGIGLGAAMEYVVRVGLDKIHAYEAELLEYATNAIREVPGVRLIGTAREKAAVVSWVMEHAHAHDIGTIVDQEGVAIRTGHHCTQPVMQRFGVPATARASLAFYNSREDIDALVRALHKVRKVLGV